MRMQGYCDVYTWTILKRTSPEVKCLHPTSSRREMCTSSISNVIYHKFSHGAAFYTLNGKKVNVMLEFLLTNKTLGVQAGLNFYTHKRLFYHIPIHITKLLIPFEYVLMYVWGKGGGRIYKHITLLNYILQSQARYNKKIQLV